MRRLLRRGQSAGSGGLHHRHQRAQVCRRARTENGLFRRIDRPAQSTLHARGPERSHRTIGRLARPAGPAACRSRQLQGNQRNPRLPRRRPAPAGARGQAARAWRAPGNAGADRRILLCLVAAGAGRQSRDASSAQRSADAQRTAGPGRAADQQRLQHRHHAVPRTWQRPRCPDAPRQCRTLRHQARHGESSDIRRRAG
ncbi:hypothetical protein D3C85_1087040 [compost metagenome]